MIARMMCPLSVLSDFRVRRRLNLCLMVFMLVLAVGSTASGQAATDGGPDGLDGAVRSMSASEELPFGLDRTEATRTSLMVVLVGALSMVPAAILMLTAFVRIQVVLLLLRHAIGSPQVPGTQVLTALALLLTALVMKPYAEQTYVEAIAPYSSGRMTLTEAWTAGSTPIKRFMVEQIIQTGHKEYLYEFYHYAKRVDASMEPPTDARDLPLHVVAPAFLVSELTTALLIGFLLYLPFLVIDLITSAVLAAMGLFMLPPTLVALPLKLLVFALAEGWWLVSWMLLRSFEVGGSLP